MVAAVKLIVLICALTGTALAQQRSISTDSRRRNRLPAGKAEVLDFSCPEDFGYYQHPTDCTQYYVCVFGGALLESCTGGLVYSHELQTCDWPRNVVCNTDLSAPVSTVRITDPRTVGTTVSRTSDLTPSVSSNGFGLQSTAGRGKDNVLSGPSSNSVNRQGRTGQGKTAQQEVRGHFQFQESTNRAFSVAPEKKTFQFPYGKKHQPKKGLHYDKHNSDRMTLQQDTMALDDDQEQTQRDSYLNYTTFQHTKQQQSQTRHRRDTFRHTHDQTVSAVPAHVYPRSPEGHDDVSVGGDPVYDDPEYSDLLSSESSIFSDRRLTAEPIQTHNFYALEEPKINVQTSENSYLVPNIELRRPALRRRRRRPFGNLNNKLRRISPATFGLSNFRNYFQLENGDHYSSHGDSRRNGYNNNYGKEDYTYPASQQASYVRPHERTPVTGSTSFGSTSLNPFTHKRQEQKFPPTPKPKPSPMEIHPLKEPANEYNYFKPETHQPQSGVNVHSKGYSQSAFSVRPSSHFSSSSGRPDYSNYYERPIYDSDVPIYFGSASPTHPSLLHNQHSYSPPNSNRYLDDSRNDRRKHHGQISGFKGHQNKKSEPSHTSNVKPPKRTEIFPYSNKPNAYNQPSFEKPTFHEELDYPLSNYEDYYEDYSVNTNYKPNSYSSGHSQAGSRPTTEKPYNRPPGGERYVYRRPDVDHNKPKPEIDNNNRDRERLIDRERTKTKNQYLSSNEVKNGDSHSTKIPLLNEKKNSNKTPERPDESRGLRRPIGPKHRRPFRTTTDKPIVTTPYKEEETKVTKKTVLNESISFRPPSFKDATAHRTPNNFGSKTSEVTESSARPIHIPGTARHPELSKLSSNSQTSNTASNDKRRNKDGRSSHRGSSGSTLQDNNGGDATLDDYYDPLLNLTDADYFYLYEDLLLNDYFDTATPSQAPKVPTPKRPQPAAPAPASNSRPSRLTLKPVSEIVKKTNHLITNIWQYPARRPAPLYPQPPYNVKANKCDRKSCRLPDCFCGGKEVPAGIAPQNIPQMVLLTFDDSVNDLNKELYQELFERGRTNPNGCPIAATFYVSHEWTDYSQVQNLYADGHEIASHSITHSFGEQFSKLKWAKEIAGQREIMAAYGGVRMDDIRGMRAPFLSVGGNKMFEMLYEQNFTYDSSMPVYENRPPSYPYTLDYKLFHDCMIPPCPTNSFPGLWEVPMVMWQDLNGGRCSMVDACTAPPDAEGIYKMLIKNFERHYTTNRAPLGLYYHAAWFTTAHHKEGFIAFLDTISSMPDVWLVTNWQALQWMRDPVPLSKANTFKPFQCHYPERPPRCKSHKVCNVWHKGGVRYMRTCQRCPDSYPWVGNTGVSSPLNDV